MLDSRPRGRGFEPHRHRCVVSLSKNINPSLVLVQPRKTCPFIIERLLMGRKDSNQTKTSAAYIVQVHFRLDFFMETNNMNPNLHGRQSKCLFVVCVDAFIHPSQQFYSHIVTISCLPEGLHQYLAEDKVYVYFHCVKDTVRSELQCQVWFLT